LESTLFTDITKLSQLLKKWLTSKNINSDVRNIENNLQIAYLELTQILKGRYNDQKYEATAQNYRNFKNKVSNLFGDKYFTKNDIQITTIVRNYIDNCITSGNFFKIMTKDDVAQVISSALETYGKDLKPDFIELIELVDKSTWFEEWDFLNSI
jgi:hypothetical protein